MREVPSLEAGVRSTYGEGQVPRTMETPVPPPDLAHICCCPWTQWRRSALRETKRRKRAIGRRLTHESLWCAWSRSVAYKTHKHNHRSCEIDMSGEMDEKNEERNLDSLFERKKETKCGTEFQLHFLSNLTLKAFKQKSRQMNTKESQSERRKKV